MAIFVEYHDIEACHRFGKADKKIKKDNCAIHKKKKLQKFCLTKKRLGKIDCRK